MEQPKEKREINPKPDKPETVGPKDFKIPIIRRKQRLPDPKINGNWRKQFYRPQMRGK